MNAGDSDTGEAQLGGTEVGTYVSSKVTEPKRTRHSPNSVKYIALPYSHVLPNKPQGTNWRLVPNSTSLLLEKVAGIKSHQTANSDLIPNK